MEGKQELNEEEKAKLKQLWKKLVQMFHPDLHQQDPEKRKTYELLTQAINGAKDRGDMELLELIAKDPQAFILKQGWASVFWKVGGLAAGRMTKRGESWMPRNAGKSELGLFFHVPLTCAPGGSAPPSEG